MHVAKLMESIQSFQSGSVLFSSCWWYDNFYLIILCNQYHCENSFIQDKDSLKSGIRVDVKEKKKTRNRRIRATLLCSCINLSADSSGVSIPTITKKTELAASLGLDQAQVYLSFFSFKMKFTHTLFLNQYFHILFGWFFNLLKVAKWF